MDAYLAVVSKREVRDYSDELVSDSQLERILQAGRATGSSQNRQPWTLVVVTNRERLNQIAETVFAPKNLQTCVAAIAVVMRSPRQAYDAGRVAQNMMIAAWADGVGTCPNTSREQSATLPLLDMPEDRYVATILSLGYPRRPRGTGERSAERVLARINRKPLDEIVHRIA